MTGEVVYTPPCCEDLIREKLALLEAFINDESYSDLDPLIKMALIHYQFEAIHPFSDGNGRTGRILNALYLCQQGLLQEPVLYLSSFIVQHKAQYYQLLRGVTEAENWQDWVMYMIRAVSETAQLTTRKIQGMLALKAMMEQDMKELLGSSFHPGLLQLMFRQPYLKIDLLVRNELAHRQTASVWLRKLADHGLLKSRKIGRTTYFINHQLMDLLHTDSSSFGTGFVQGR
jgi:Fic family protein